MEKITITQSRYDELLKSEYAVGALKAYANETTYLTKEVICSILTVAEKKAEPAEPAEPAGDDF